MALVAVVLVHAASRAWGLQWDLKTYLLAARAAAQGLDPYDQANLSVIAGRHAPYPWLYPPIALLPFQAMAALPTDVVLRGWVALKILALGLVAVLWRRDFLPEAPWTAVALACVFAGDGAALADLRAGNVGIFEAALLALAFSAWLRGRARTCAALVVLASLCKLLPILYLALLFVPANGRPARPRVAIGAFVAFVALVALPLHLGWPVRAEHGFLHNVPNAGPVGEVNPTLYALIETMTREFPAFQRFAGGGLLVAWAVLAIAALGVLLPLLVRDVRRGGDARRLPAGLGLLEALLSPRLMQYGFVRAGLPLLFWSPSGTRGSAILAWSVLVSLPGILRWTKHPYTGGLWPAYLPLLLLVVVFIVAVRSLSPRTRTSAAPG